MSTPTLSAEAKSPAQAPQKKDWRFLVLPAALLALWTLVTQMQWVNTKVIVPPGLVLSTAWTELQRPDFYQGVAMSLGRDLAGFTLGGLAGVVLGVLLGVSSLARSFIGPTFHTLRQISLFAWLPLLAAIAGSGDLSKIVFIAFSAFYPVVLATCEGVAGVSVSHLEVARVYRFTPRQVLTRLILPSASPHIVSGLKLGLIYAWMATIGAEFLLFDFSGGIGQTVFRGRAAFRVDLILFGLFVIGLVGYGFTRLALAAEQRLLRWQQRAH
jgi:sulfonate transport system permease protein